MPRKNEKQILVFVSNRPNKCDSCAEELAGGAFVVLGDPRGKVTCLSCADLDHLVYLPSGDAALTRRSRKYSSLSAVVLKFSRARKRSERQGILVESEALDRAERECAADASQREKRRAQAAVRGAELDREYVERFAGRIRELYPRCSPGRETTIAEHACRKYSGRVGRSAAAKELDEKAVRAAVLAHIRHTETQYDELLVKGWERQEARSTVNDQVLAKLKQWEKASS